MSLRATIDEAIKAAMKARDKTRLETVRAIKKLILEQEVEARAATGDATLTEEQELTLLNQLAKQRREAMSQYEQAGRPELAAQEAAELAVIEEYLPQQLSEAEVEAVVQGLIEQVGASSPKDMGKVMGPAMQQLRGRADGKVVQALVKRLLGD